MRQFMTTVMALAAFGAIVATAQAENQTPSPPTVSSPVKKRTVSQTARRLEGDVQFGRCMRKEGARSGLRPRSVRSYPIYISNIKKNLIF
jgi:hypothetical protein